jgi:peptidoglycan DL-endopeptidase LytF
MKISKRDTIIIAVLVNVALLSILFATAMRETRTENTVQVNAPPKEEIVTSLKMKEEKSPTDEIDTVLQEYALKQKVVTLQELNKEAAKESPKELKNGNVKLVSNEGVDAAKEKIEVKTKKKPKEKFSDKSKKAAKAKEIKAKDDMDEQDDSEEKDEEPSDGDDIEYYVIKSGDNPWKVAKKFHVKYEDLLALNGLNEEKAKNLKIGQKIRIR